MDAAYRERLSMGRFEIARLLRYSCAQSFRRLRFNMAISTIYLAHHSYTRNGCTSHPFEAESTHFRILEEALSACEADENVRWTCDVSGPAARWLQSADAEQAELFEELARAGRLEVCAFPYHLNGAVPRSAMPGYLGAAAALRERGVPIRTAMALGSGGVAAGWIDLLAASGIEGLMASLPDPPGDGGLKRPDAFWWVSPSGSRLAVWNGLDLEESRRLGIGRSVERSRKAVLQLTESLESDGFYYDFLALQVGGANQGFEKSLPAFAAEWNENLPDGCPEMAMAVPSDLFARLTEKYGANMPARRGEWNDWRSFGLGSSAAMTARSRRSHAALNSAENLLAFDNGRDAPENARGKAARRSLLLFDEHTGGSPSSVSDPYGLESLCHRNAQESYALEGARCSEAALEETRARLSGRIRSEARGVAVFNPHPWPVSALAEMKASGLDTSAGLIDAATGEHVPKWVTEEGVTFSADNLPPLGYKAYVWGERASFPDSELTTEGNVLENRFYRLEMDEKTGTIKSLRDKRLDRDLVDSRSSFAFGQLLHERIDESEGRGAFLRGGPHPRAARQSATSARVRSGHQSPLAASLTAEYALEGCRRVRFEATLYEHCDWIDFAFSLDKLPIAEAESAYAAFPFFVPNCQTRFGSSAGFALADEGLMEGAVRDWVATEGWIDFSNDSFGVTIASPDAPLAQLGRVNTGRWLREFAPASAHFYSWLYNNYGAEEFPAEQSGEIMFRYRARSYEGAFDAGAAHRLAQETLLSPAARPLGKNGRGTLPPGAASFAELEPRNASLSIKRAADGIGRIARVRELSGRDTTVRLRANGMSEALRVSPLEEDLDGFYPVIDGWAICFVPAFGEIALRLL